MQEIAAGHPVLLGIESFENAETRKGGQVLARRSVLTGPGRALEYERDDPELGNTILRSNCC